MVEALYDDEDLARLFKRTPSAIRTWRMRARREGDADGFPPVVRIGRTVRVRASDLAAWVESRVEGRENGRQLEAVG